MDTSEWTTKGWLIQCYKYVPSAATAILFAFLFGISTATHLFQLIRWKKLYFIPFFMGTQASKSSSKTKPNAGKEDIGNYLAIGGLVFQHVVVAFFMVVKATFRVRIRRRPTIRAATAHVSWLRYIYVLYIGSALIMIRSIFRVTE